MFEGAGPTIAAGGRDIPIGTALAMPAEIVTGRRRIIQYLLSPPAKTADGAVRER